MIGGKTLLRLRLKVKNINFSGEETRYTMYFSTIFWNHIPSALQGCKGTTDSWNNVTNKLKIYTMAATPS